MTYKIVFNREEYVDEWGHHEPYHKEFDIPYHRNKRVWYCYKKRRKYIVRESEIIGVWATNICGVILDNNWHISDYDFDRLFQDKDEAIDWCIKQNQRDKVKIEKLGY